MGNHNAYGTEKGAIRDGQIPEGMPAAPALPGKANPPHAGVPQIATNWPFLAMCEYPGVQEPTAEGYDVACGMQSFEEWFADFAGAVIAEFVAEVPMVFYRPSRLELYLIGREAVARRILVRLDGKRIQAHNMAAMGDVACADCQDKVRDELLLTAKPKTSTRVYFRMCDVCPYLELPFVRWSDDGLHVINELGNPSTIPWTALGTFLKARELRLEGEMPERAKGLLPGAGPIAALKPGQRRRESDEFCASHSGGGGFIKFEGEYRPWSWIRRNCVHAICGSQPDVRRSKVGCYGHYKGAMYFQCTCPERHLFERTSDLKWRVSRRAKDEAMRAGELKAVRAAYPWIYGDPDANNDVDW